VATALWLPHKTCGVMSKRLMLGPAHPKRMIEKSAMPTTTGPSRRRLYICR
jgi:hypothetical protein